jgi:hypothetical protein
MDLRMIFSLTFGLWQTRFHRALGQDPKLPYMKGERFVEPAGNGLCSGVPDGHLDAPGALGAGGAASSLSNSGSGATAGAASDPEQAAA